MNPTLYDILGVAPDASRDEIRKAWREAADRFEPGEGGSTKQFRLFNEAAEVLLDPDRRKAYDAELAERGKDTEDAEEAEDAEDAEEAEDGQADGPVPAGVVPGPPMPGAARAATPPVVLEGEAPGTTDETPEESSHPGSGAPAKTSAGRLPVWVLAVLGVVSAAAVGVASYLVAQAGQAEAYQESLDRAPAAAEAAAAAVLSYDYESLEADRDAAAKFLTPGYRSEYVDTFDTLVMETATEAKATVEAQVLASSAMLGGAERDAGRVPVLLFVNQTTTSTTSTGAPPVALNRVRFDMVNVDGTWLVDGITSY